MISVEIDQIYCEVSECASIRISEKSLVISAIDTIKHTIITECIPLDNFCIRVLNRLLNSLGITLYSVNNLYGRMRNKGYSLVIDSQLDCCVCV